MARIWGAVLVLMVIALPLTAEAQNNAKVSGQVIDASTGEPLPGASVVLEGTTLGAATNADGEYIIFEVPPGSYTVTATFVGYTTVHRQNVEIIGGITNLVSFELQPATVGLEEVVVQAEVPLVNPTSTSAVRRLSAETIQNLPTRDVSTYYAIQPGVTRLNGEIYIRGGRPSETQFMLEGISSRSLMGADNVLPVIPEALAEIQVYAGGYSAEYGGANAGMVRQVLRTGGQEYHGMIQYETDRIATAIGDHPRGYQNITATLGGPLVFNNLRFFVAANYEDTENYNPMFWYGADLGQPIDEITGDTAVAPIILEDGVLPGIRRPREQLRINGTLQYNIGDLRMRLGFAQLTQNRRINSTPIYDYFNQRRLPRRDDIRRLANLQANYFLSSNTYLEASAGIFQYNFEIYDPLFDKPVADGNGGAVLDLLDYYTRDSLAAALAGVSDADTYTRYWRGEFITPNPYKFHGFDFARPGDVTTAYARREQSYYNFGLSLTTQQNIHELKIGGHFKRWTVRNYTFSGGSLAAQLQADSLIYVNGDSTYAYYETIRNETPAVARIIRRSGDGGFGYDEFMNEVNSGPDDAKHPTIASVYINDQLEYNDIIINAGLRLDYFDMDTWTVEDPSRPGYDPLDWTVRGMKKAPADIVLQPRLGFSFPVTSTTAFHLQYGKFAQMPDMQYVYEERADIATSLSGQFLIVSPFAWELDPIKSTQYEIGLQHQFTDFAAFDITAFYRKTRGQIEIVLQEADPAGAAADYNLFTNGDFAIARGIELSLRTRRVNHFMAMFNYTLTDAQGTNSEPGGQVSALENDTAPPSLIQPLSFEERHRGSFILDFSTGPDLGRLAENWTINLLTVFHSGHRYTTATGGIGQRGAGEGPLLPDGDPRSRIPTEPINASTTPWYFRTDLRIEKGFTLGPSRATAFMYVENLLNRRNVINVYVRTGDADSDGFFSNPELSQQIVEAQGEEYERYYRVINLQNRAHYRDPISGWGRDLFGDPRSVRIGLRLEF